MFCPTCRSEQKGTLKERLELRPYVCKYLVDFILSLETDSVSND